MMESILRNLGYFLLDKRQEFAHTFLDLQFWKTTRWEEIIHIIWVVIITVTEAHIYLSL